MGADYDSIMQVSDTWPEEDQAMYFRQSKEYDLIKNKKSTAVIETKSHEFSLQKK